MTLLAEHQLLERAASGKEMPRPASVEQLVPRLGEYLLRNGYVTQDQLRAALAQQAAAGAEGKPRLGQTLVDMGVLSRESLDQVIAQQILELHAALVDANRMLEQRVAERTAELEAALVRLTEFNQLKANFVANISHELRTPLTQIKGYNALMLDAALGPLSGDQKEALRVTSQAIERLEQLIDDLISYAYTAKGELSLKIRPALVAPLIDRALDKSATKAAQKGVTLKSQYTPDNAMVLGDEEKLYWVFLQLLDNAIKFTPAGGRVTVSATQVNNRVRLAVADTGIGIPRHRLADIFADFQQLDGTSTRRYGGTGLGLALVRRIVEAHGSEVEADSEEGRGSTMAFTLARPSEA